MYKLKNNAVPPIFHDIIEQPKHRYTTKFSNFNFSVRPYSLKSTKFSISLRGPKLWNDFLDTGEKHMQSLSIFQNQIKAKLLKFENEAKYF